MLVSTTEKLTVLATSEEAVVLPYNHRLTHKDIHGVTVQGGQLVILSGKQVLLYTITPAEATFVQSWEAPKRPTRIVFTSTSALAVSDKYGTVSQCLVGEASPVDLLGHLSLLSDLVYSAPYLITADEDAKVRVTCFPNTYNIQSFCLGHAGFVARVCMMDETLVSAGSDGTVRAWNPTRGEQLDEIRIGDDMLVHVARVSSTEVAVLVADQKALFLVPLHQGSFGEPKRIPLDIAPLYLALQGDTLLVADQGHNIRCLKISDAYARDPKREAQLMDAAPHGQPVVPLVSLLIDEEKRRLAHA